MQEPRPIQPTTVQQLITWLQAQPQDAPVYLRDPDTGWCLPIRTGENNRNISEDSPPNAVMLHADYHE